MLPTPTKFPTLNVYLIYLTFLFEPLKPHSGSNMVHTFVTIKWYIFYISVAVGNKYVELYSEELKE